MKVRVWVTGRQLDKNRQYNCTRRDWIRCCNYINKEYPQWEMMIIFNKEDNTELKRYYNYDNKKTFPQNVDEI